jgi:tRNA threonylcarbamoyladenosine dehydratase
LAVDGPFSRTALLLGDEGLARLAASAVAVIGVGGVGSYAIEALARCGVGSLVLVDGDIVQESNLNRQIHATVDTIGRPKVEAMRERVLSINPEARVEARFEVFSAANGGSLVGPRLSYLVDAIDTVSAKIELVLLAKRLGIPVISSMGAGNKLDPSRFEVADLFETSVCPLARVMRRELKRRGIDSLKVVYSREEPTAPRRGPEETAESDAPRNGPRRKPIPGSVSFVPSSAGLLIASEVVRDLLALR